MISTKISQSRRGIELTQSPIRSLIPYARIAKEKGIIVNHLNIGQPDIPTPPEAIEAIRKISDKIIKYGPSEGLPSLREKVAEYYLRFSVNINPSDIFVTTGASEAILFTLFSCCDEHDEIIIPEPFYANYIGFAHTSSVNIVPLTTTLESRFELPEPEEFELLITAKTKAIFLCNPGNPTGQLYSKEKIGQLIEIVEKYNLFLIVDEVYREFCYDDEFTSVLTFSDASENIVVIDSISKVFSSCGARVGFLITKNQAIKETVNKYAQLRLCPPFLGQVMAEACYDFANDYIEQAKEEYKKRRKTLYEGLLKIDGVKSYLPAAAFYNMVELPFNDSTAFCKWLLSDFSHNNETIMMAPADGFYYHKALGKSQVRIAYVLNQDRINRSMELLDIAIRQYAKLLT
jgi:aspartate aminotransferase